MNAIDQARAFMDTAKDMSREALWEAVKRLPSDVQTAYWELRKTSYFVPENEIEGSREEVLSPSGRYKLVVSDFSTGPTSWNYTQGTVYRNDDERPIATVQRNYGVFPHLFIEGHAKGDFLLCGQDYQGQTLVELQSGTRRDIMSDGSENGAGFCWAAYRFDTPSNILVVEGCIWACPYEYRFFDFADPMSGWPEIEADGYIELDERQPVIEGDIVRCYVTREPDPDEDDADDEAAKKPLRPEDVIKTFRREGRKLVAIEEWVSDYEKDRRGERAEAARKYEAWLAHFKATDPLYLAYAKLVEDPALSPESSMRIGRTYDGWCPDLRLVERRCCRRVVARQGAKGATVDLKWAVDTGPIKLVLYRDGHSDGQRFFEHSLAGMEQAFAFAKQYAGGER